MTCIEQFQRVNCLLINNSTENMLSFFVFAFAALSLKIVWSSISPTLNGVFYELYTDVATWNISQWQKEFESMKTINISYVAIRTVYDANYPNYTVKPPNYKGTMKDSTNCPFGIFTAFYPSSIPNCTVYNGIDTTDMIFTAAYQTNIQVHLGLAFPIQTEATGDATWWDDYLDINIKVFNELYSMYYHKYKSTFAGIYTVFEIGNFKSFWYSQQKQFFISNFLNPLSNYIHNISNDSLKVWGSPYYKHEIPNTNNSESQLLNATQYAKQWSDVFKQCSNFDFIAPQDGVGASNNSDDNYIYVKNYLSQLIYISELNNRQIWSNAESFQFKIWNQGTNCRTIETAPFDRFKRQLQIESNMTINSLISWEYHSYISPYSGPCPKWSNMAHQFYKNYSLYLQNLSFS